MSRLTVLAAMLLNSCSEHRAVDRAALASTAKVYFRFSDGDSQNDFIAGVADPSEVRNARAIVAGKVVDGSIPMGQVIKGLEPYNPSWHFNFDPSSLRFVARAPQACNVTTSGFERAVTAGTVPPFGSVWCPYGERPVQELPAP